VSRRVARDYGSAWSRRGLRWSAGVSAGVVAVALVLFMSGSPLWASRSVGGATASRVKAATPSAASSGSPLLSPLVLRAAGRPGGIVPNSCFAEPPNDSTAPTVTPTGSGPVGQTLTLHEGTWVIVSGACSQSIASVKYAWYRAGTAITGASGTFSGNSGGTTTYQTQPADVGHAITAVVTACDIANDCNPVTATGSFTPVTCVNDTTAPAITPTGPGPYGQTLTSTEGTWTASGSGCGTQISSVTYGWFRSGTAITGTTGNFSGSSGGTTKYQTQGADSGHPITAQVTACDNLSHCSTVTANGSYTPNSTCLDTGPVIVQMPVMSPSDTGAVGTVLSTTGGTWHDVCAQPFSDSFQWYRGTTAISGATNSTYTTTSADVGVGITVQVTACSFNACSNPATATGMFVVQNAPLGSASDYPMWSHGPVSVNEATGNAIVSLPTPSYPTATGSLGFSLTYNSQSTVAGSFGLGTGWLLSAGDLSPPSQLHDHSVDTSNPYPAVEIDWPDGSAEFYQQAGTSSTYQPLQADGSKLTETGTGSSAVWTYIASDGSAYTFSNAATGSGTYPLQSATLAPTDAANGQLSYTITGGKLASVSYKETSTSSSSETLSFNWSCVTAPNGFCVTGPDGVTWSYTADRTTHQITTVNDGTRNLMSLAYTSGQVTKIQNADDLDPSHSSPGYNGSHALTLTYDTSSPTKLTCLIDGPISGQAATAQPACANGSPASESTWSFNYAPGCPTLQTPAVSHSVAQGTSIGCTTLTDPNQQPSGPGVTVLYDNQFRPLEYDDARLGSGSARINLVQYNALAQIAWSEDPAGDPTDYSYDPWTNALLSVTGSIPVGGGSTRPVTTYRYDEVTPGTVATPGTPLTGLAGSYWTNSQTMSGLPATKESDPAPGSSQTGFTFSTWPSAVSGNTSGFSAQWTGEIHAPHTGDYSLTTTSHDSTNNKNDGTRLVIDGLDAIDNMSSPASPATNPDVYLTAGTHLVTLQYAHRTAGTTGANITLTWACADCSPAISSQTVPISDLTPAWENQTSVVSPADRVTFTHYPDPATGQSDYTDIPLGNGTNLITSYVYDSLGRVVKKYMPKANASMTINSSTGNLTGTPNTAYETDYTYYGDGTSAAPPSACGGGTAVNQYGQLETTSIPNGGLAPVTTVYNAAGLPISNANGKGTSCLIYDAESRLTSETPNGDQSHPVTYTYDPNGTALTTTNQNGIVTTYYDEASRLIDTTDASGAEAHFSYDADGNTLSRIANIHALSGTTCPSSNDYCTIYAYDAADELSSETDAAGHSWSFYYDGRGNLRGTQYPNGTFSWVDTDPAGNTSDVLNRHGTISSTTTTAPADSNPLADFTYTYVTDSVYDDGKIDTQVEKSGSTSQTTTYGYDLAGRLELVALPNGDCRTYSYDLDSNRTQVQDSPTGCSGTFSTTSAYTYDPTITPGTDELTKIVAGSNTTNYAYTSDGQVSSQGANSYTWNGLSQLATATVGSNTVTYNYDGSGDLQSRTTSSPSTTTHYLAGDLFETNSGGAITTSFTDGPGGNLASYSGPPTSSSTPTYLYYDAHGNLVAEANTSGTVTASHTYDPFGTPLDSVPANATVHRFVGRWDKQYDTTTGDILMGARSYDPNTGRFLSVDPLPGGSLNNYDYAGQDPLNNYDLSGTRVNGTMQNGEVPMFCEGPMGRKALRKCASLHWSWDRFCARFRGCHTVPDPVWAAIGGFFSRLGRAGDDFTKDLFNFFDWSGDDPSLKIPGLPPWDGGELDTKLVHGKWVVRYRRGGA
jgi:RHS repeat-associated protein